MAEVPGSRNDENCLLIRNIPLNFDEAKCFEQFSIDGANVLDFTLINGRGSGYATYRTRSECELVRQSLAGAVVKVTFKDEMQCDKCEKRIKTMMTCPCQKRIYCSAICFVAEMRNTEHLNQCVQQPTRCLCLWGPSVDSCVRCVCKKMMWCSVTCAENDLQRHVKDCQVDQMKGLSIPGRGGSQQKPSLLGTPPALSNRNAAPVVSVPTVFARPFPNTSANVGIRGQAGLLGPIPGIPDPGGNLGMRDARGTSGELVGREAFLNGGNRSSGHQAFSGIPLPQPQQYPQVNLCDSRNSSTTVRAGTLGTGEHQSSQRACGERGNSSPHLDVQRLTFTKTGGNTVFDDMRVMFCEAPQTVYVCPNNFLVDLSNLTTILTTYVNTFDLSRFRSPPMTNSLVVAKFEGEWYRGVVREVIGDSAVVFFCDYGNSNKIHVSEILPLPERAVQTPCKTFGIVVDEEITEDILEELLNQLIELSIVRHTEDGLPVAKVSLRDF